MGAGKSGIFLRRYIDKLWFLRRGMPVWKGLTLIGVALAATGYLSWLGVERFGYTQDIRATETLLDDAGNLRGLWYSPQGGVIGYRQDGWKIVLLRWSLIQGKAPAIQTVDLDKLTPPDAPTSTARNGLGKVSLDPSGSYVTSLQAQQSPNQVILPNKTRPPSPATSTQVASRITQPIIASVSQDLSIIAWVWNGKVFWVNSGELHPSQNQISRLVRERSSLDKMLGSSFAHSPTVSIHLVKSSENFQSEAARQQSLWRVLRISSSISVEEQPTTGYPVQAIDLPVRIIPNGVTVVGNSGLIVQSASAGLLIYEIPHGKLMREMKESTTCAVTVMSEYALLACAASDLTVLNFSSLPPGEKKFRVKGQPGLENIGFTAFALSANGLPAVATDRGTVLVWSPSTTGGAPSKATLYPQVVYKELQSPGVAQSLSSNSATVLAGGGFRGIFLLEEGTAPKAVVDDTAGTTHVVADNLKIEAGTLQGGHLAFANREGASAAILVPVRFSNNWTYLILGTSVSLWLLILVVIPGMALAAEEVRRQREVRLRGELERSMVRVPTGVPEGSAPIPLPDPPEELVRACVDGDCVGFIGAGMGAQAGLPTWRPLIQTILSEMNQQGLIEPSQSASLQEAFNEGQTDLAADGLVSSLRGQERLLYDLLTRTFLRPDIHITRVHSLLRSLNLSAVLTTNFDNLLDTTFSDRVQGVFTHQDADRLLQALSKRQFFLLKLYGSLDRPESVLLAPFQYLEAMARNVLFSRFMESLFSSRTLLFVGASLEGIESYLTGIKLPTSMPQRHFALVAVQSGAWRAKADLLTRRFGIQVLGYTPQIGYPEIGQFLDKLAMRVNGHDVKSARKVSRLKKVTLDNIGPFDHLELQLDGGWNILLGDNGVGKSTILRAIAVGIAGPDAADFAGRLIKSSKGSEGARIVLETDGGKQYITEIRRGDKTIVESRPSRPLEPEGWVALGFPPLRSFTAGSGSDLRSRGLLRLTSEDLMPLIRGEVDPRLDNLKGWIIDLDYRDKNERVSNRSFASYFRQGDGPTQFTRLLDQFFEVIRRLTPGLKLGRVEIDADKKEVRVETDDGVVPIELISQGTQSLLGWVGVLLQRLNDFYATNSDQQQIASAVPALSLLDQYALVLMDEIDAHMHPKWQQLIVDALKKLFPNAQFIATTHSPLIVAGLDRREVRVVRRAGPDEPHSGHVVVESPKERLKGLRADQILTGTSLFNLESTLAPELDRARQRYTTLAALENRSDDEQREFEALAENLEIRIPAPYEREVARQAFEKVQEALEHQLVNLSPEKRKKLMDEVKVQTQENVTGSRRP